MHEIKFYYDKNGVSDVLNYLKALYEHSKTSKNHRINHDKIAMYLGLLKEHGTFIGEPVVKHIANSIWELRPLQNRIFFFHWKDNKFVLLHHFVKKTRETPKREITKAQNNLRDHIERHGK